jgi:hypothetical protein
MDDKIYKIFEQMKAEKLSALEREEIRAKIVTGMRGPVPTYKEVGFVHSTFTFVARHFAVSTLVILILVGGGVSYASENSLPGSNLYRIKVGFNEKIMERLAFTPDAKVSYSALLIEKRLAEAEVLRGIEGEESENVNFALMEAENKVQDFKNVLESNSDKVTPVFVALVTSDVEAVLEFHGKKTVPVGIAMAASDSARSFAKSAPETSLMMAAGISEDFELEEGDEGVEETASISLVATEPVISKTGLEVKAEEVRQEWNKIEEKIRKEDNEKLKELSAERLKKAEERYRELRKTFERKSKEVSDESKVLTEQALLDAESKINRTKEILSSGSVEEAAIDLRDAERAISGARILIKEKQNSRSERSD